MNQKELSKRFLFEEAEKKWLKIWEERNLFHAQPDPHKKSYTIVIPPPNVTGILHMGHALNNILQDIMIRYKRMNGFATCWMPGTDHAGIATQNVVEKDLAKEGKTRHDLGREKFLERLWNWKEQYGDTIINQLKKLGASCDWTRTRFTMDEDYSEAVKAVFIHLYRKGLIYQGERIINWCPRCQTALSDEEAEHQEHAGSLYHIRYPWADDHTQYVIVATTRPETMLGDTAVAVHPTDKRYKNLIGKTLLLPIVGRRLTVIADEFVNPEFGSGAVKVTPAHDPNDFEMGKRHDLPFVNVMHSDGRMNEQAAGFSGMDRFVARAAIVNLLKEQQFLEKIEGHQHSIAHCYRCQTIVEPYLSKQWFVKMQPLAKPAMSAVKERRLSFHPDHWTKVYLNWMENIRDWCISRQIWWGHRIPVWYDGEGNHYVARDENEARQLAEKKLGKNVALIQDPDVLDTWFSSWLWPFATFGWPNKSADLKYFYPGDSLFTASEIIFFWVARMIMAGYEFMGDLPFSQVYIHGTVRDAKGRKMSKSLGNAIDPLEIISEYGADALRFSLIMNSGQDLYISKDKFEVGRNFANKIWNASRLVLMNVQIEQRGFDLLKGIKVKDLDLPSRWIISKFFSTLRDVNQQIDAFRFSEAENSLYEFFWRNYCDWYLEIIKGRFRDEQVQKIVFALLEKSLRMMHPFIPFVTEEIWEHLQINDRPCSIQPWPELQKGLIDAEAEKDLQDFMELVTAVRNTKAVWQISLTQPINVQLAAKDPKSSRRLNEFASMLKSLVLIEKIEILKKIEKQKDVAAGVVGNLTYCVPLGDVVDVEKEKHRMKREIATHEQAMKGLSLRLKNGEFLKKAPADVVEKERERLVNLEKQVKELNGILKNFS